MRVQKMTSVVGQKGKNMKLIDADKLIKSIEREYQKYGDVYDTYEVLKDINAADTVNAIPVNWIIKWSAEHMTEFGTLTIERMLEDWRQSVEQSSKDAVKKTN